MRVDSDGVGIDAQGAIGEVAVAIYSGMDYHEVRDKKPDQGADLIAPYGSVAVKCRDATKGYPADYLKAPHLPRNCSADFACLTWIINRTAYIIRLVGFLKYDDFNHLVKKASENGVYVPRDGWHVQWQAFCSTGVSE